MKLRDDEMCLENILSHLNLEYKSLLHDLDTTNKSISDKERLTRQNKRELDYQSNLIRTNKQKHQEALQHLHQKETDLKNRAKDIDNLLFEIHKHETRFE